MNRKKVHCDAMPSPTRGTLAIRDLPGELLFDETVQMITNHRVIEAFESLRRGIR